MLAAVGQNGNALDFAAVELKADREAVLAAGQSRSSHSYMYVLARGAAKDYNELRADRDFVKMFWDTVGNA